MSFAALILAGLALGTACVALVVARRNRWRPDPAPSRTEQIETARAAIMATQGVELALEGHHDQPACAIILAQHRSRAAHARALLRTLGETP